MSDEFREKIRSIGFVGTRLRGDRETFQRDYEKHTESELSEYRAVRKEGSQPDGTQRHQIEKAKRISDELGVAYDGADRTSMAQKAGIIDKVTPIRRHGADS